MSDFLIVTPAIVGGPLLELGGDDGPDSYYWLDSGSIPGDQCDGRLALRGYALTVNPITGELGTGTEPIATATVRIAQIESVACSQWLFKCSVQPFKGSPKSVPSERTYAEVCISMTSGARHRLRIVGADSWGFAQLLETRITSAL